MNAKTDDDWKQLDWEVMQLFSPGAPIDESELFAGRTTQVLRIIDAVFQRGQHVIVYGERGVGKTSFANTFSVKMSAATNFLAPIINNCDPSDDYTALWKKVFRDLTRNGQTLADSYEDEITPDDVRRELSTFSLNTTPIIILDEFDQLRDNKDRGLVANTIKALSDHSVRATMVLVGVAQSVGDLIKEHESISRALVQILMPRMELSELEEIIDKRLPRVGMNITRSAMAQITALSRGLPHYTHLLGQYSARRAIRNHTLTITEDHVEEAERDCLERVDQSTREQYHKAALSPRQGNIYKEVLLACALAKCDELGFFPAKAVRAPLSLIMRKPYEIAMFGQHLKKLCEYDRGSILEQIGSPRRFRYRFVHPLMQPYVILRGLSLKLTDKKTLKDLMPSYQQSRLSSEF